MDCSPPGFSVNRILQARILEWVAIPFSRGSSQPRDWTQVSCIASRFFTVWATREAQITLCHFTYSTKPSQQYTSISPLPISCAAAKSLQLCPTLCDPIDGSQLGSPIPGILQARVLEWVAISFSTQSLALWCTFYFYILIFYKLHITSSNISFYLVKHASDYDFFRFLYMIKSLFHLFFKVCLIYILCWRMCSFHSLMLLLCVLAYIVSIKKSAVHFIFILLYIISTPLLLYPVAFEIFPLSLILSKLIM